MKYATWKLNFSDLKYGTGPESTIAKQNGTANGAFANGDITNGAEILGYFTGEPTNLEAWSFTEITQEEALTFVKAIDSTAHVTEEGHIAVEIKEVI